MGDKYKLVKRWKFISERCHGIAFGIFVSKTEIGIAFLIWQFGWEKN